MWCDVDTRESDRQSEWKQPNSTDWRIVNWAWNTGNRSESRVRSDDTSMLSLNKSFSGGASVVPSEAARIFHIRLSWRTLSSVIVIAFEIGMYVDTASTITANGMWTLNVMSARERECVWESERENRPDAWQEAHPSKRTCMKINHVNASELRFVWVQHVFVLFLYVTIERESVCVCVCLSKNDTEGQSTLTRCCSSAVCPCKVSRMKRNSSLWARLLLLSGNCFTYVLKRVNNWRPTTSCMWACSTESSLGLCRLSGVYVVASV